MMCLVLPCILEGVEGELYFVGVRCRVLEVLYATLYAEGRGG